MNVSEIREQLLDLRDQVCVSRLGIFHPHLYNYKVRGLVSLCEGEKSDRTVVVAPGTEPDSSITLADSFDDALNHFQSETSPILHATAIFVLTKVARRRQKLV